MGSIFPLFLFIGLIYLSFSLGWKYTRIEVKGEIPEKGLGSWITWGTFFGSVFLYSGFRDNEASLTFLGIGLIGWVVFAFLRRLKEASLRS